MSARIGLVTCVTLPEPDPDQSLMLDLLNASGVRAELIAWDDTEADPGRFDLCVLRSCWNYHEHPADFLAWCDNAAERTQLLNPAAMVRWNIHKRYLADLEKAGFPIVPTAFVDRGSPLSLPTLLAERGWSDIVVKPCVSAGSARTRRFRDASGADQSSARAFSESLVADTDIMIQPFVASVEDNGERSAIWIGGDAIHAIIKQPRFHDDHEQVSEAQPLLDTEREMLDACAEIAGDPLLYARLDTMRASDGTLMISELELIEPSLFLLQSERAQRRFVEAVIEASA